MDTSGALCFAARLYGGVRACVSDTFIHTQTHSDISGERHTHIRTYQEEDTPGCIHIRRNTFIHPQKHSYISGGRQAECVGGSGADRLWPVRYCRLNAADRSCLCLSASAFISICLYVCINLYMYTCTCIYTYTYTYTYT